jgi:hypothetical protein
VAVDDEEIGRGDLADLIREKRAPRLGGRSSVPGYVFRNGRLADVNAELQEFAVNERYAPQAVGVRHRANQLADVRWNTRSTQAVLALPRPKEPEAAAMQARTVSGLTITRTSRHPPQSFDRKTHSSRSARVSGSRLSRDRFTTWSW